MCLFLHASGPDNFAALPRPRIPLSRCEYDHAHLSFRFIPYASPREKTLYRLCRQQVIKKKAGLYRHWLRDRIQTQVL